MKLVKNKIVMKCLGIGILTLFTQQGVTLEGFYQFSIRSTN